MRKLSALAAVLALMVIAAVPAFGQEQSNSVTFGEQSAAQVQYAAQSNSAGAETSQRNEATFGDQKLLQVQAAFQSNAAESADDNGDDSK